MRTWLQEAETITVLLALLSELGGSRKSDWEMTGWGPSSQMSGVGSSSLSLASLCPSCILGD